MVALTSAQMPLLSVSGLLPFLPGFKFQMAICFYQYCGVGSGLAFCCERNMILMNPAQKAGRACHAEPHRCETLKAGTGQQVVKTNQVNSRCWEQPIM